MTTSTELNDLERRAYRYDAQDGLMELLAGILFFFVARSIGEPHLAWVPALLIFPMRWAMRFFKERFTYPRIGYVKLREEEGRDLGRGMLRYLGLVVLIMAVVVAVSGDITSWGSWKRWLPGLLGGFTAGGFIYAAGRSGLWRHWLLVVICVGWGITCSVWDLPAPYEGMKRWALGLGLVCLVMGAVTFLNFLRTHPVRDAEVADEQV